MIPRYSRPEMTKIWNTTSRFQIWLDIEKYACEAQEKLGVIPKGVAKQIDKKGKFEIDKIDAIEKEVSKSLELSINMKKEAEKVRGEKFYSFEGLQNRLENKIIK